MNLMKKMKVKVFSVYYNTAVKERDNLEDQINDFLEENAEKIIIKDIKYSSSFAIASNGAKFIEKSALIIYEES